MTQQPPDDLAVSDLRQLISEQAARAREGSPEQYRLLELLDLSDDALLEWMFSHLDPNPTRVGCPPHPVLVELATRVRDASDLWWDHLLTCGPCRSELRALRRRPTTAAHVAARPPRWAAAAVLTLIVAAGMWFATRSSGGAVDLTADLRPFGVSRSAPTPPVEAPVVFPRRRARVTLQLPTGSEPGRYDVDVRSAEGRRLATTSGEATLRAFATSLRCEIDLRDVAAGSYELAVRRAGEDWQRFPIRVE